MEAVLLRNQIASMIKELNAVVNSEVRVTFSEAVDKAKEKTVTESCEEVEKLKELSLQLDSAEHEHDENLCASYSTKS